MPTLQKYIPAIGTSGTYEFLAPFDAQVSTNERFTLKSVRTISDYIASNEDIYTELYLKNSIQATFEEDQKLDIEILGVQSERGAWVYVPVRYVKCYPSVNGIPYRTVSIVIPVPPIPVDMDLAGLLSQLQGTMHAFLGVDTTPVVVESSKVMMVPKEDHDNLQAARHLVRSEFTPEGRILVLSAQLQTAIAKVYALEQYILAHP